MGNALEFILKLTDMLSPSMRQAAQLSESASGRIQSQFDSIRGKSKYLGSSVNELKNRLEAINQVRFSTTIAREFEQATRAAHRLENQIAKLDGSAKGGSGGGSMLGNFVKGNLISGAITSAMDIIREGVGDTYQTALKNSSLNTAINSTTKGQGQQAVSMTSNIVDKYGLDYESSLEGVKTLTGGLMGMNIPLEKQMKIFEGVSAGVAAMKLGSEQSKGAMLALGQMASKGTVSAEELRGQLGERIPGAFNIAARAMNMTEAQLGKMMQKGEIASKDFLPKFAAEMQKTFGAAALSEANGPAAIQNKFNKAIFLMKASIGEGLMPVITPMIQAFTSLATTVIPYIREGLSSVINFVSGINLQSGVWADWFLILQDYGTIIWNGLKGVWTTIYNIGKGVFTWLANSQMIKDLFWGIGKLAEGIFWVVNKVGQVFLWIWNNVIKPFLDAIEWVYNKVKSILGLGGKGIEIKGTVDGKIIAKNIPGMPAIDAKSANSSLKQPTNYNSSDTVNQKAETVNNGGQRSITIQIAKQSGVENLYVTNMEQGIEQIESMVKEMMRRTLLSINNQAVAQ
jgi:tape measure domain-containing protein